MATISKTFSVKNGLDVANTIVLDSNRNLTNVNISISNVTTTSLNVTGTANIGTIVSQSLTDAYNQANTARDQANTARDQANTARNTANSAYDEANLKLNLTGGTVSGDLTVQGNLFLTGNATYINVATVKVNDSIIQLSTNSTSDAVDIGFVGHYSPDGGTTNLHAGFIRRAADDTFYIFDGYGTEPTNNIIDVASANLAWLRANVNAASLLLQGNTVATQANLTLAFNQANTARDQANTARDQANVAANLVAVYANGSLRMANANVNFNNTATINVSVTANGTNKYANVELTANSTALGIPTINSHLGTINTTFGTVNTTFGTLNTNITTANAQANIARDTANGAYAQANAAANTVAVYANDTIVLTKANVNFNNSATVNVGVTANSTTGRANIQFTVNTTSTGIVAAGDQANTARDTANGAYGQANAAANTVAVYANDVLVLAKSNVNFNNSATVNVSVTANTTTGRSNVQLTVNTTSTGIVAAYNQANAAYDAANTKVSKSGDTMTGALTITTSGTGLTVANANVTNFLTVAALNVTTNTVTTSSSGQVVLDTFPIASFASAKYFIQANSGSTYHTTEMILVQDGTNIHITEYGSIQTGASLGTFTADLSGGNARLLFTAVNNVNTIRAARYAILAP